MDAPVPRNHRLIDAVKIGKNVTIWARSRTAKRVEVEIQRGGLAHWAGDAASKWYAFDFETVAALRDATVSIEPLGKVVDRRTPGAPTRVLGRFQVEFRLGELLATLLDEIGFHGSPKQRDGFKAELERRLEDVDRGHAKRVPWPKVLAGMRARIRAEAPAAERERRRLYRKRHHGDRRRRTRIL